jgi:hypothetical protein
VGTAGYPHGGTKSAFDQLPLEATALLLAAEAADAATGRPRYPVAMERAYAWFLGANDLGLRIADPIRGFCHDGLAADGLIPTKGSEATLLWLIAAERIRRARAETSRSAGTVASAGIAPGAAASTGRGSAKDSPIAASAR